MYYASLFRMSEAAGIAGSPPCSPVAHAARPGEMSAEVVIRGVDFGTASTPAQSSRFWRLVPGPDCEEPLAGGRLRIVALELFDDHVAVHWRLAPPPDPEALFSSDLIALDAWPSGSGPSAAGRVAGACSSGSLSASSSPTMPGPRTTRPGGAAAAARASSSAASAMLRPSPEAVTELVIGADGARFTVDVRSLTA
jgi:hypothetical protein